MAIARRITLITLLLGGSAFAHDKLMGPQGDGLWLRNAGYGELQTLDSCFGHQPGTGDYHHHASPGCLRHELGDNITIARSTRIGTMYAEAAAPWHHSPILGWAIDGFPIYGPYGFSVASSAASPVKRLVSGFSLRRITTRTSLPSWSLINHSGVSATLSASVYGPAVSTLYPLGRYVEDFEYISGQGDLNQYNGRFEVTPDFPNGIYAYHVTINADGTPAFPYILAGAYAGTPIAARGISVPSSATVFAGSSSDARLASWRTVNNTSVGHVITGYDPTHGAQTTWPTGFPSGTNYSGGSTSEIAANIQNVRYTANDVYINSNGIPDYTLGPWFDATDANGGVFSNYPSKQNDVFDFNRSPATVTTHTSVGLGAVGLFVSGAAAYNFLDGSSYSHAQAADIGGGTVQPTAVFTSSASGERGPQAPGALIEIGSLFGASFATATATAASTNWPTTLAGTSVSITDSAGTVGNAWLFYVSPSVILCRLPKSLATGFAKVTISGSAGTTTAHLTILSSYPHLFYAGLVYGASGTVSLTHIGITTKTAISAGVPAWGKGDRLQLSVLGTGRGSAGNKTATAIIDGTSVPVATMGNTGATPGIDYFQINLPKSFSGSGKHTIAVTVGGRISNTTDIVFNK